jgi:hypothetical protein
MQINGIKKELMTDRRMKILQIKHNRQLITESWSLITNH